MKGSEAIIKTLLKNGTDVTFGFPGGAVIPLFDKYLDYALNIYLNERRGEVFERCLAKAAHRAISENEKYLPLPFYPNYIGFNATNNKRYDKNLFKRVKYIIYYKIKLFVLKQTI